MSGIFWTYIWYGKWVDIFQVYVGIFQTYRPSGQIYGIFQEYVRISNFYEFQMLKAAGGGQGGGAGLRLGVEGFWRACRPAAAARGSRVPPEIFFVRD